jgi:hypothetical protein
MCLVLKYVYLFAGKDRVYSIELIENMPYVYAISTLYVFNMEL